MNRWTDRQTDGHLLPRNRKKAWINKQTIAANMESKRTDQTMKNGQQMNEQTDE